MYPGPTVADRPEPRPEPRRSASSRNPLVAYLDPRPRVGRFSSLHGYRAIAALSVVVYHVAGYAGMIAGHDTAARILHNLGNFGVAVFFLLSGFLLYLPFVKSHFADGEAPDPVIHLRRRLLRIWPAYAIALGAFLALGLNTARDPAPDHFFTLFSLTQVYRRAYGFAGLGVAWTLCIEIAFYIALPFLAAGIRGLTRLSAGRRPLTPRMKVEGQLVGLAVLAAMTLLYRTLVAGPAFADPETYPFAVFHLWLFNYFDWFALGMGLAVAIAWRDMGRSLPGALVGLAERGWLCWVLAAACYGMLVAVVSAGDVGAAVEAGTFARETLSEMYARFALNGLGAFFFLLPGILGTNVDPLNRALRTLVPVYLGTVSYGIYLWHKVWLDRIKIGHETPRDRLSFWVMLAAVAAATLVTASLSWYLVEQPMLRKKKKPERETPPAPPIPEPMPAMPVERW